jgi:uncharacterized protein
MRIGLISDTHGSIPARVLDLFEGVDLILHAGDVEEDYSLAELEAVAKTIAVRGNMDIDLSLDYYHFARYEDCGILVMHRLQDAYNQRNGGSLVERYRPQLLVFGHTHYPTDNIHESMRRFNPGSPNRPRDGAGPTVGMLNVSQGQIQELKHLGV